MPLLRDKIIVVDVEATCWEGNPPPGEYGEIIEIGVCSFDLTTRQPGEKRSLLVKPARSKVSEFCTQLTTLTQEQVDTGMTYAAACAALQRDFGTEARVWTSWGNFDRTMFQQQCASFYVPYPFSKGHINLKNLFAKTVNQKNRAGMAQALTIAGLTLVGTHHRGDDDAWNIARLLGYILEKSGDAILDPYFTE